MILVLCSQSKIWQKIPKKWWGLNRGQLSTFIGLEPKFAKGFWLVGIIKACELLGPDRLFQLWPTAQGGWRRRLSSVLVDKTPVSRCGPHCKATLAAWLRKYSSSSSLSPSPPPPACPCQKNCYWLGSDLAPLCSLAPPTCSPAPSPPPPPPLSSSTSPGQWTRGSFGWTPVLCTQSPTAPPHGNIFRRQVNPFTRL